MTIAVDEQGYPFWTRIELDGAYVALGTEEACDLLYAMQRIVAWLDFQEEVERNARRIVAR